MRHRGLAVAVVSVLLLLLLAGLVRLYVRTQAARDLVRTFVERSLAQGLGLPVELGAVAFSPAIGRVELRDLTIRDPAVAGPLLEVGRVRVSLSLLSLLAGDLRVRSVVVREPRAAFDDTPALRERLGGIVARLGETTRQREGEGFPLRVEGGVVRYRDGGAGVEIEATDVAVLVTWGSVERATVVVGTGPVRVGFGRRELRGIRLAGEARVGREVVEVDRLRLERDTSALTLAGMILTPGGPPRAELTLAGELALPELAPPLLPGSGWNGRLSVGGKLFGEGLPRAFEGRLTMADGSLAGVPARLVTASVLLRPDRFEVASLSAQAGGGTLQGAGSFEPASARWRAGVQLAGVELGDLLSMLGGPAGWRGRVSGSAEANGQGTDTGQLVALAELRARGLRREDGSRMADGTLAARVGGGLLRLDRLLLTRRGSRLSLEGTADLRSDALALRAEATVADLGRDLWPVEVKGLTGRLEVSGQLGETWGRPRFTGRVSLKQPGLKGWRADLVEGPIELTPTRLASRALRLGAGRTAATLAGEARLTDPERGWGAWRETLALEVKAELRGRIEELTAWSQTDWPLAGPVMLQARVRGTPARLEGGGVLEMGELRVGRERFEALRATLAFEGGELTVPRLTARRGGVALEAGGAIDLTGRYRFALSPLRVDLGGLPPLAAAGVSGRAVVRARGAGALPTLALEGDAVLTGTAVRDLETGDGRLAFALEGGQWRWGLDLALGLRAAGVAPLAFQGPLQAEVTASDLDLAPLLSVLHRHLPFPLGARTEGRGRLRGTLPGLEDLSAQMEMTDLRGQAGQVPWRARETVRLSWEGGALRIEPVELAGPGLAVTLKGTIRPRERVDLDLAGHAPLPLWRPWAPVLADLRGVPEARVTLAGPPGALRVSGRAELAGVGVKLDAVPLWLQITRGEARFDHDAIQYRVREGEAGGGRIEGQGTAERRDGRWRHTLEFRLDKAQAEALTEPFDRGRRWVRGDLFARASLAFDTGPEVPAFATLRGRVSAVLDGGSLGRYPALVRIFGLLGTPAQPLRLPDLASERLPYRQISADFAGEGGVMETKNLLLDSEVVRVSGVGKVFLADRKVDFDLAVRPLQVLEQGIRRLPLLGRLLPQEQSLVVTYFEMQGPWGDPSISAAPVRSLGETVVDLLLFLLKAPARVVVPER